MTGKKKEEFDADKLLEIAEWHLEQGHRLVCKPGVRKSQMPKKWQHHPGQTLDEIQERVKNGCKSIAWVLDPDTLVVDVDNHPGGPNGIESKTKMLEENKMDDTYTVITGGGGFHHIYTVNENAFFAKHIDEYPGIDFMHDYGYVVIEGSLHESGRLYKMAPGSERKIVPANDNLVAVAGTQGRIVPKEEEETPNLDLDDYLSVDDVEEVWGWMEATAPPEDYETWQRLMQAAFNIAYRCPGFDDAINRMRTRVTSWSAQDPEKFDLDAERMIEHAWRNIRKHGLRPGHTAGMKTWREWATEAMTELPPAEEIPGLFTMGEFQALDLPEIEYTIEPFLPTNALSLIHAKPGVGKTWMVMDLAIAQILGRDWLGIYPTKKLKSGNILIIDGEMPEPLLQIRWKRLLAPLSKKERAKVESRVMILSTLTFAQATNKTLDFTKEKHQKWLGQVIRDYGIVSVTLDNRNCLFMLDEENSNDGAVNDVIPWFIGMRGQGIQVTLLGHTGHTGEHLRGGSKWNDNLDTIIHLNARDSDIASNTVRFTLKFKKARYGLPREQEANISLIDVDGGVALLRSSEGASTDLEDMQLRILTEIVENPGVSQRQVAEKLDTSQAKVKRTKAVLVEAGLLQAGAGLEATQAGIDRISGGPEDLKAL